MLSNTSFFINYILMLGIYLALNWNVFSHKQRLYSYFLLYRIYALYPIY